MGNDQQGPMRFEQAGVERGPRMAPALRREIRHHVEGSLLAERRDLVVDAVGDIDQLVWTCRSSPAVQAEKTLRKARPSAIASISIALSCSGSSISSVARMSRRGSTRM